MDDAINQCYSKNDLYEINLASDLNGHIIGIVADTVNNIPVADVQVSLEGNCRAGSWQHICTTNQHGLFITDMPLGLSDHIHANVIQKQSSNNDRLHFSSPFQNFQFCHTPLAISSCPINLNGLWKFALDPSPGFHLPEFDDHTWSDITVPAHWVMEGFYSDEQTGGYRLHFQAPFRSGRSKLRFDSIYSCADVWINGHYLRHHDGGATPFELDISDVLHDGLNVLALRVKQHSTASDHIDKMSQYADFDLAGIYRDVYLFSVPDLHIGSISIDTALNESHDQAILQTSIHILNESDCQNILHSVELIIEDSNNHLVSARSILHIDAVLEPWQTKRLSLPLTFQDPHTWTAEDPFCYTLIVKLKANDNQEAALHQRIGIRQIQIDNAHIMINHTPVKLKGVCHHDSYPLTGRSVTESFTKKDLRLVKLANLNAIRTSHYPPSPCVLDICDELGLYVEAEAPICWVDVAQQVIMTPILIQLVAEMYARSANHPSIIMWSMSNESSGKAFALHRALDWIKKKDPSRPAILSGCTSPESDMISRHNPITLDLIEYYKSAAVPVIWDESFNVFQEIYGDIGECWIDPGMRDYYIEPLIPIYEAFYASKTVNGSMIWAWSDEIFCVPNYGLEYGRISPYVHFAESMYYREGRGLVGDAPWGLVDGWRRQKPEYWLIKKMHTPVRIPETPIDYRDNHLSIEIENRYDFTNLSELSMRWFMNDEMGVISTDLAPKQIGYLDIYPNTPPKSGDTLRLTIHDNCGHMVDDYLISIHHVIISDPVFRSIEPTPLSIHQDNYLSSHGPRFAGNRFDLSLSLGSWGMNNGFLHRNLVDGLSVLLEFPTLHVLRTGHVFSPLPDRFNWVMDNLVYQYESDAIHVTILGHYPLFEGEYTWVIHPDGCVQIKSRFTYMGNPIHIREKGLRISVPRPCDHLTWNRNAEWRIYPADHIGRPEGSTTPFPKPEQEQSSGSWGHVHTPMGCADFRSTKRNINWIMLTYPNGIGILARSDGTQHARAIVEADRISLHINDFYGGTDVGKWAYKDLCGFTDNYPMGYLLKTNEVLESNLNLQLIH